MAGSTSALVLVVTLLGCTGSLTLTPKRKSAGETPLWCGRPYSTDFESPPAVSSPPEVSCHIGRSFFVDGADKVGTVLISSLPAADAPLPLLNIKLSVGDLPGHHISNVSSMHHARPGTIQVSFAVSELPLGTSQINCHIGDLTIASPSPAVRVLPAAIPPRAVLVDFSTGGLLVDGLPFFVTSFYTRWPFAPLDAAQADKQHTLGFNTIAPYGIAVPANESTIEFLDRCAQIGMKVQYHLSILTQGAVLDTAALTAAVEAVKGHPAILSYYIADEPDGPGNLTFQLALRDRLVQAYGVIKKADPFHPISLVLNCLHSAPRYLKAVDVLMTDPYTIGLADPVGCDYCTKGVLDIETRCQTILQQTSHSKPLWLVNQAFGGGEHWRRTPSSGEMRAMVYLGLVSGMSGMQAFAFETLWPRFGMWAQLQQLSREIALMTPFLLSDTAAPVVMVSDPSVRVRACRWQGGDGVSRILVVAVNPSLIPVQFSLSLGQANGTAVEMFEDMRTAAVVKGEIHGDMLTAYGTRVWLVDETAPAVLPRGSQLENLQYNPSFELAFGVQCPDFGYMGAEDSGSSFVIDTRLSVEGLRSMRLTTTTEGNGVSFRPYGARLKAGSASLGLYARGAVNGLNMTVSFGSFEKVLRLSTEWTAYNGTATIPSDGTDGFVMRLDSAGIAWVDAMHVYQVSTVP